MKGVDGGPSDYNKGTLPTNIRPENRSNRHVSFAGKPYFSRIEDHISEETGGYHDGLSIPMGSPARSSPQSQGSEVVERFSRKVFVGGLPPDIDEGESPRSHPQPTLTAIVFPQMRSHHHFAVLAH